MAASLAMKLIAEFFGAFLLMVSILVSGGYFLVIGAILAAIVVVLPEPAAARILWCKFGSEVTTSYCSGFSDTEPYEKFIVVFILI